MAYLALFMATGGTAYAVNEWTGDNIVDGSLTAADLAPGAVTGPKVATSAVDGSKVLDNSIKGTDVDEATLSRVPDANTLDGLDSTAFAKGRMLTAPLTINVGTSGQLFAGNDIFEIKFTCSKATVASTAATLQFFNKTTTQTQMFADAGDSSPVHRTLAARGTVGDSYIQNARTTGGGDFIVFQTQSALGRFATVWVSVISNNLSTCHVQAQALTN